MNDLEDVDLYRNAVYDIVDAVQEASLQGLSWKEVCQVKKEILSIYDEMKRTISLKELEE